MSIFGKIKDAIFGNKAAAQAEVASMMNQGQQAGQPQATFNQQPAQVQTQAQPQQQAPATAEEIDQRLAQIAAQKGAPSNYKTSIVDLMKLLDLDPSLENRKELAQELGYTGALDGSAEMNIWLHKQVMASLANRGQ